MRIKLHVQYNSLHVFGHWWDLWRALCMMMYSFPPSQLNSKSASSPGVRPLPAWPLLYACPSRYERTLSLHLNSMIVTHVFKLWLNRFFSLLQMTLSHSVNFNGKQRVHIRGWLIQNFKLSRKLYQVYSLTSYSAWLYQSKTKDEVTSANLFDEFIKLVKSKNTDRYHGENHLEHRLSMQASGVSPPKTMYTI